MGWCARTEVELGSSAGRVGGYSNGKELRGCGLVRRYLQAKRGGWFTDAGYQPPDQGTSSPDSPYAPGGRRAISIAMAFVWSVTAYFSTSSNKTCTREMGVGVVTMWKSEPRLANIVSCVCALHARNGQTIACKIE
jgi:hypothetical protein